MKKAIWIGLGILLTIVIVIVAVTSTRNYRIAIADSYTPYADADAIDLYNASREELIEFSFVQYSGTFGKVENAKEAVQIAEKVIQEVYENDESPYVVKFNETANAWIVHGTLPSIFHLGGVASIAIDQETGGVLMVIHTK